VLQRKPAKSILGFVSLLAISVGSNAHPVLGGDGDQLPQATQRTNILLEMIRDSLKVVNPRVDRVAVLDLRCLNDQYGPCVVIGHGIRSDRVFEGNFADELFGVFEVDIKLSRIIRVFEVMPTRRWSDYEFHIDLLGQDSLVVGGAGRTYGDDSMRRAYSLSASAEREDLPLRIVLGKDKAVYAFGQLFLEGDEVELNVDPATQAIVVNGIVLFRPPHQYSQQLSLKAQWVSDFMASVRSSEEGSLEERVTKAIATLGDSLIDPKYPMHVANTYVKLQLLGDSDPVVISLTPRPPYTAPLSPTELNMAARKRIATQLRRLQGSLPYFWFEKPDATGALFGDGAQEAIDLARKARTRPLTEAEQTRAGSLGLQPEDIQAIAISSKAKDR
jgi:hypothetical protein